MPSINLGQVRGDKGTSMRNRGEWNSALKYVNDQEYIDLVSHNGSLWTCLITNTNVEPSDAAIEWNLTARSIDTVYFEQASKRENIISGESADTAFGKIAKWFSDIKSAAFYNVVKSLNITEEGYLMDGKTAAEAFTELNSNIESLSTVVDGDIAYYTDRLSKFGNNYLVKKAGVVYANINVATIKALANTHMLATIPDGFRPRNGITTQFSGNAYVMTVSTDGKITAASDIPTGVNLRKNLTWVEQ